jgi:hypothetical protein
MSSIDLSNPGVLRNFLLSQAREGNGEFTEKENVVVFKDKIGLETVVSDEFRQYLPKKKGGRPKKEVEDVNEEPPTT